MKIVVLGAGSIGCFIGGSLIAAGGEVVLLGRHRMAEIIASHGMQISDLHGRDVHLSPMQIHFSENSACLAEADLILVTVKSLDTPQAARTIAEHASRSALVVSFQNGVGNAEVLREVLPGWDVLGGMVPFNVVQLPKGRFHRGTEGELVLEAAPKIARWKALFESAGLPLQERSDFASTQWGKLLVNLNNSINALSGLPLKEELSQRGYRFCLASLVEEGMSILRQANIQPAKIAKVAPAWLPHLLRLPDFAFVRLAAAMLRVDPEARSSMWEDLQAGRRTEVDYLNGAVVKLAVSIGMDAPFNRRIVELIRKAETGEIRALSADQLVAQLGLRN